jgi:hypothetical protein
MDQANDHRSNGVEGKTSEFNPGGTTDRILSSAIGASNCIAVVDVRLVFLPASRFR